GRLRRLRRARLRGRRGRTGLRRGRLARLGRRHVLGGRRAGLTGGVGRVVGGRAHRLGRGGTSGRGLLAPRSALTGPGGRHASHRSRAAAASSGVRAGRPAPSPATVATNLEGSRMAYELVVVANRLPVDITVAADGTQSWQRSPGGLV